MIVIAKLRFNMYLFTFVVAIYSSSYDIELTFATETIFGVARNFQSALLPVPVCQKRGYCSHCTISKLEW